jgi:hypothetical protein
VQRRWWIIIGAIFIAILCVGLIITIAVAEIVAQKALEARQPTVVAAAPSTTYTAETIIVVPSLPVLDTATPWATIPPIDLCQRQALAYAAAILPKLKVFSDAQRLSIVARTFKSTAPVADMQSAARDIEALPQPECVKESIDLINQGVDQMIECALKATNDHNYDPDLSKFMQAMLDAETGISQIQARIGGEPTPTRAMLPPFLVSGTATP